MKNKVYLIGASISLDLQHAQIMAECKKRYPDHIVVEVNSIDDIPNGDFSGQVESLPFVKTSYKVRPLEVLPDITHFPDAKQHWLSPHKSSRRAKHY